MEQARFTQFRHELLMMFMVLSTAMPLSWARNTEVGSYEMLGYDVQAYRASLQLIMPTGFIIAVIRHASSA